MNRDVAPTGNLAVFSLLTGVALGALAVALATAKKRGARFPEGMASTKVAKANARETGRNAKDALAEFQARAGSAKLRAMAGMREAAHDPRR
jgi:hypothetical protein